MFRSARITTRICSSVIIRIFLQQSVQISFVSRTASSWFYSFSYLIQIGSVIITLPIVFPIAAIPAIITSTIFSATRFTIRASSSFWVNQLVYTLLYFPSMPSFLQVLFILRLNESMPQSFRQRDPPRRVVVQHHSHQMEQRVVFVIGSQLIVQGGFPKMS